jgi:hypothetical protein
MYARAASLFIGALLTLTAPARLLNKSRLVRHAGKGRYGPADAPGLIAES